MKRCNPFLALTFFVSAAMAEDVERHQEIALNLGWGHPLGTSLEYSVDVGNGVALGVGAGISGAGGKYGLEGKRFFFSESKINPYMGLALSKANGIDEMTVTFRSGSRKDTAVYSIGGGIALAPRAGVRFRISRVNLSINGGYGFVVTGGGVERLEGAEKQSTRSIAEAASLGGLEVSGSVGIMF